MNWRLPILLLALGSTIAVVMVSQNTSGIMNCGGNSAALANVHQIALVAANGYGGAETFSFTSADESSRKELAECSRNHWVRQAHFLVTTQPFTADPRRLIVVCDTSYTNVPEQRFFSAPPAHAAGYSDGTAGLISPAEFAALDRSTFVALDQLYPPPQK